MTGEDCARFRESSAELALGVLEGRPRAEAILHLERCDVCRAELAALGAVADRLAGLAPPAEPPAGFESRALAAVTARARAGLAGPAGETRTPWAGQGAAGPAPVNEAPVNEAPVNEAPVNEAPVNTAPVPTGRHRGHRGRRWAAVAAAVAVAASAGWAVGRQVRSPSGPAATVAVALRRGGDRVGELVAATGADPWISMALDAGAGDRSVRCELRERGGRVVVVGSFTLRDGYGYWAAPLPVAPGRVVAARVVTSDGGVVASAALPHGL